MKTAYRNRIYPSTEQANQLMRDINAARFVWNNALGNAKESKWNYNAASKNLTELKQTEEWLKEASATALSQKLMDLKDGFTRFFRKQNGFPHFRSKDDFKQSVRFQDTELLGCWIKIPKCGWIRLKLTADVMQPKMITISREGKYWFASFSYEMTEPEATEPKANQILGLDLGLKDFAITTNEYGDTEYHKLPELTKKEQRKRKYMRMMHRRKKGSKRRSKAKTFVAKASRKITNIRRDFHHKLSNKLTCENQALAIETLNVKGMQKNRSLARAIQESSWSQFITYLLYKAERRGNEIIRVDRWFPSSKTCSNCGTKNTELQLKDRKWTCNSCSSIHNRDENAARNLVLEGLRSLYPEALGNLRSWSDVPLFLGISTHDEARMKMAI